MKFRLFLMPVLALILSPLSLVAQEVEEVEEESPWSAKARLGYLATSGNTENSTLNTGFEIGYATGNWKHLFDAAAITSSENRISTAEAYDLGWKSERNFTDHDFMFGRAVWRKDKFGAFNTQFSQTIGYGRRLIKTDKHSLNVELGFGARQSTLQIGGDENETVYTVAGHYQWQLSETAEFSQDLKVEAGESNNFSESVTAISAKLMGDLSLVASYTVRNNSDVPPSAEKTDTFTALLLEYSF
jgi:putative salt-induced outer membrane protein